MKHTLITFSGDTSIYLASELTLDKALTIDGEHHAITVSGDTGNDGTPNVRVFDIAASGVVTLNHLNIVKGYNPYTTTMGGGIYNAGRLIFQNSTLAHSVARLNGGGLFNEGTALVQQSAIWANEAGAGVGIANMGQLTLDGSTVSANWADYGGGGIYNAGTLMVTASTLSGNLTPYIASALLNTLGGGLYNCGGQATLRDSTVFGNRAAYGGGTANASCFDGGGIPNLTLINSTLSGNLATFQGGGLYNYGAAHGTLTHVTVSGNGASTSGGNGMGGGIYNGEAATLSLKNSLVAGNTNVGLYAGWGDCYSFSNGTLTSQGYNLVGPDDDCPHNGPGDLTTADPQLGPLTDNGGAAWTHALLPNSPAINGVPAINCPVATDQRGFARPYPAGGACDIGAYEAGPLYLRKTVTPTTTVTYHGLVTYTLVLSNTGPTPDASVWLTDTLPAALAFGQWVSAPGNATVAANTILWNGALAAGQAVTFTFQARHTGNDGNVTVTNRARFSGVTGLGGGQASFNVGCLSAYTVQNSHDAGDGSLRQAIGTVCPGGIIHFSGDANIYLASELAIARSLTIDGEAHAITISGDTDNNGLPDVRVFNIAKHSVVTLSHLNIVSGAATNKVGGNGGGLLNQGTLTLRDSIIAGNTAAGVGGGLYNYDGALALQNTTFSGNTARSGGGIYSTGALTVENTTFSGNTASNSGGGIYSIGALTVSNSALVNNLAGGGATLGTGGGLQVSGGGIAYLRNCTFGGNEAKGSDDDGGGAMMIYSGAVTLVNCTVAGNRSATYGGGVSLHTSSGDPVLHLYNTIVAMNTATTAASGPDLYGDITSHDYNLIQDTTGATIGGVTTHDLTGVAPGLGPLADNGGPTWTRALLTGSPAINAGNDAVCPITDQRGIARPQGAHCDIGAYEFVAAVPPVIRVYLPLMVR